MLTPRIVVNSVVALAIALFIGTANAFMIGLDGATSNGSDALYALDRHGREVKIAQTGTVGPDWVMVEDIGLPTIASDGTVLFGAARESNHQVRWSMFVAQPDSGAVLNVVLPDSFEDGSSLEMKADPRPQQTADGGIIFLAHESSPESSGHQPSDDDALFKIAHGKLQRLVRTGERLSDGRTVHLIAFGSIRPESQGGIAFSGYLEPGGQAELMVSESGEMTILAIQDKQL